MALLCPITLPAGSRPDCVGHFISQDQVHRVAVDGYDLVFEQLLPKSNGPQVRLYLAMGGRIVDLYRVPVDSEALVESTGLANVAGLDVLLIHVETARRMFSSAPQQDVSSQLVFKVYDPDSQQLAAVSSLSLDVVRVHVETGITTSISVNMAPGPTQGGVFYSRHKTPSMVLVHPLRQDGASPYTSAEGAMLRADAYWLESSVVLLARKRRDSSRVAMDFISIKNSTRRTGPAFKFKVIHTISLPPGLTVRSAGPLIVDDKTYGCVILSDDSISTYEITDRQVVLVDEKRFELPPVNRDSIPDKLPVMRLWTALPYEKSQGAFFASSDGFGLKASKAGSFTLFKTANLPKLAHLTSAGSGIFKLRTVDDSGLQLVRLRVNDTPQSTVFEYDYLRPKTFELIRAKLIKYEYNEHFGSTFWYSFGGLLGSNHFCKYERALGSLVSRFEDYPFAAPVTGMWYLGDRLLVSTEAETATYIVDGHTLNRVESQFDTDAKTIAAAPSMRITNDTLQLADGTIISLPLEGVIGAAIDVEKAAVANDDTVIVLEGTNVIKTLSFDDMIVGLDICAPNLAVCTTTTLYVVNLTTFDSTPTTLQDSATSIACSNNGRVYVGDARGYVFEWPEGSYVKIAPNPIGSVRRQPNGVTALVGSEMSVRIDENSRFSRLAVGHANDITTSSAEPRCGVVLVDGVICPLVLESATAVTPRMVDVSEIVSSKADQIIVRGDFVYSFRVAPLRGRKVVRAPFSNLRSIEVFELPPALQPDLGDFQIFMITDTRFVEICSQLPVSSEGSADPDSENDDEDDEDDELFETHIFARVYELEPEAGTVTAVCDKDFTIPGDPYEEIVVKFYSPDDFLLFTHSSSAIGVRLGHNGSSISAGKAVTCHDYIYDDHWIHTKDGVIVLTFAGDMAYTLPLDSHDTSDLLDCFCKLEPILGNIEDSNTNSKSSIFDVVEVPPLFSGHLLLAFAREASRAGYSKLVLLDVELERAVEVSSTSIPDPVLSVVAIDEKSLLKPIPGQATNRYRTMLQPNAAVGTSKGAAYLFTAIQGDGLSSTLVRLQARIRESLEVISPEPSDNNDSYSLDGGLLLAALNAPGGTELFNDAGLAADDLRDALNNLMGHFRT